MNWIDYIFCPLIAIVLIVAFVGLYSERGMKISPAPTLPWVRRRVLRSIMDGFDTTRPCTIADLGCGWGGIVIALYRAFPAARIIGYEMSFFPWLVSVVTCAFLPRVSIRRRDFFKADISGSDIVFCYLSPYHMETLKTQLLTLKPGSIVISCAFPIPGWTPEAATKTDVGVQIDIFRYRLT